MDFDHLAPNLIRIYVFTFLVYMPYYAESDTSHVTSNQFKTQYLIGISSQHFTKYKMKLSFL